MSTYEEIEKRVWALIGKVQDKDQEHIEHLFDTILWFEYGQRVFSQFGYGVYAWTFRQRNGMTTLVIKGQEKEVPLVAFVTSSTPRGCVEQMFDLLLDGRLRWQKDKYPSI